MGPSLLIISHTPHFETKDKQIVGWGPTVREIDYMATIFDQIYHIVPLTVVEQAPGSALPYRAENVTLIPIEETGGTSLFSKWSIIKQIPQTIRALNQILGKVDVFHFRAPTGIGVYLIPYLTMFSKKKGWYKYAGNWEQPNMPLTYRLQKWVLERQKRKVTINGIWPNQKAHMYAFENPCLTEEEVRNARARGQAKIYSAPYKACFVGGLTPNKGLLAFLEALATLDSNPFEEVFIVGDGPEREKAEALIQAQPTLQNVRLLGFLPREEINAIYEQCHFLVLPSLSEGFPKVVAEAAAFGCLSMVTDVSCIGQYVVDGESGFLLENNHPATIAAKLQDIFESDRDFKRMAEQAMDFAASFTYARYLHRIKEELLG